MIKVKHSFSKVFSFNVLYIPPQKLFPIKQMRLPAVIRNHALQFLPQQIAQPATVLPHHPSFPSNPIQRYTRQPHVLS
jgi:hypothetical protein